MAFMCPVCGYPDLPVPPQDYEICPSCGTEFEYHDARRSHSDLRQTWIRNGFVWHSQVVPRPQGWNGWLQIINAKMGSDLPQLKVGLLLRAETVIRNTEIRYRQNVLEAVAV
jgi:hypothetical protein